MLYFWRSIDRVLEIHNNYKYTTRLFQYIVEIHRWEILVYFEEFLIKAQ